MRTVYVRLKDVIVNPSWMTLEQLQKEVAKDPDMNRLVKITINEGYEGGQ